MLNVATLGRGTEGLATPEILLQGPDMKSMFKERTSRYAHIAKQC